MRFISLPAFLLLLLPLLGFATSCESGSAPTLPLPPPVALVQGPPDAEGMVTVLGEGAIEGAQVFAFEERTMTGVIGTANDLGQFELRLAAESGDTILVWQRVGTQTSELIQILVPTE